MFTELDLIRRMITLLAQRRAEIRANPDGGYSTEAVIVTALLVAMAITAVAIITTKVIAAANHISTN